MERTKDSSKQLLEAVSSLKRALGIPNHPTKRDTLADKMCHIYSPDAESAELIGELLYKYAVGQRGAAYYDSIRPRTSLRDTISTKNLPEGGYDSSIHMPPNLQLEFADRLQKMIRKQIAPDKNAGRGR